MRRFRLYTISEVLLEHVIEAESVEEARLKANGAIYVVDGRVAPCDDRATIDVGDEWHLPHPSDVEEL